MTPWSFSTTGNEVVEAFKDRVQAKTIVITGPGAGGVGAEAAITLAAGSPALLILAGRTESKVTPIITEINTKYPTVATKFVALDLSSLASVRTAAAAINELVTKIDILINNAGIMAAPYSKSADGFESQFVTNYLGHFLLTNLLIGKILKASPGARIVNVSSVAYSIGVINYDDVNFEDGKTYNAWAAYGQSKGAVILFGNALATKLKSHGSFAFSLHPGFIMSNLQIYMDQDVMIDGLNRQVAGDAQLGRGKYEIEAQKTVNQGCATTLIAALEPDIEPRSGGFLVDGQVQVDVKVLAPPERFTSKKEQEKLWGLSEKLVGEKFSW